PPPAAGHRPAPGPLPRPAPPRREGGLPWRSPRRHQPLPRLRHLLRHPQGPPLHPGPNRGPARRPPAGRHPAVAAAGGQGRRATTLLVAGSGLLRRGRDPLLAGGPPPVLDAPAAARPRARPPQRAERLARIRRLEAERLVALHLDRR